MTVRQKVSPTSQNVKEVVTYSGGQQGVGVVVNHKSQKFKIGGTTHRVP